MSDSMAGLHRKIGSATDLQSVVRTMKALAASSIGQYEQAVQALAHYDQTVELALGVCLRATEPGTPGALPRPATGPTAVAVAAQASVGIIVFGSDQGLVGRFNERLVGQTLGILAAGSGPPTLWAVGERAHARLTDAGLTPRGPYAVPTTVRGIPQLVDDLLLESESLHGRGEIGEVHLVYNRRRAGTLVEPVDQRLLPLDTAWRCQLVERPWPTTQRPEMLGGGLATTLPALVREHLFISLFRACAESLASENASRLTAMERADRNIDGLLETLHGAYHRLRQSSIDEELFDVLAGFEASNDES